MGCCSSNAVFTAPALEDIDMGPPYSGPQVEHNFMNVDVTLSAKVSLMSNQLVTCNVEEYYPLLAEQYDRGYKMVSFYHIPGQGKRKGFFSNSIKTTFQGIFSRTARDDGGKRQLRVEKSIVRLDYGDFETCCFSRKVSIVSDLTHMQQIIESNAMNGARLICIEFTGREEFKRSWRPKLPSLGVDIFFEVPLDRASEIYTYKTVSSPILVTYTNSFRPVPVVHCDWQKTFDMHLNQGYRLVEIFMDDSNSTQSSCCGGHTEIGCKWFFEKPVSKIDDTRPVYEGKIVEHVIKISLSGMSEVKTRTQWEPVIQAMGDKGWELACILETSNIVTSGFATVYMKVLLFFQRKIHY
ncbi:hypothetical protein Btru_076587 [Bulinus truncatus]|nr:hypothetical protein Btru_076587 [Bulinus truncatus]